jgi:hypothetical protein
VASSAVSASSGGLSRLVPRRAGARGSTCHRLSLFLSFFFSFLLFFYFPVFIAFPLYFGFVLFRLLLARVLGLFVIFWEGC